jgi:leucyl aminopeptidase (aminopeptidase T)
VVAAAAAAADVWVALSWTSFVYSEDWKAAVDGGTQYVSYEGIDVDGFVRCVGRVDTPKLARMGEIVIGLLSDAEIRVTSAAGTDIAFDNRGGKVGAFAMIANKAAIPVMLAGQVSWEPREASMTGTLVADGILSPPEEVGLIVEPLRIAVEAGRITGIEGGREATRLKAWLAGLDDDEMTRIAHASIGFNPGVPVPTGRILEDERAFGDLDFGWGAWVGRPAAGHFDFTCRQVSMTADGVEILREGRYVHPELASLCAEMGVAGHAAVPETG